MAKSLPDISSHSETKLTLEELVKHAKDQYGAGVLVRMGDGNKVKTDSITTGLFSVDSILGCGGYPKGRVIEVFGPEGGGKTTLALTAAACAQAQGLKVAYVDAEQGLNPDYAARLGVKVKDLYLCSPDYGEQALEVVDGLVSTGEVGLIVVDSVAALVPKAELDGEMGDAHMGLHARLMSQALRKVTSRVSKTKTSLIFINQIREKIGVLFGNPETTTGGRALRFYASVRLDVRRSTPIKNGDKEIGVRTKISIVKNRFGPPKSKVEVDLIYGEGFSVEADILDYAEELGVIRRSGSWYYHGEKKVGQGREQSIRTLKASPELSAEIKEGCRNALGEMAEVQQ